MEQDNTRKRWVDKNIIELEVGNNDGGEYKVEAIYDSAVYIRELAGYLLEFYYLVFWKNYPKKILRSFIQWSNTFGSLSTCFTKIILISRQQSLRPLMLHHW